MTLIFPSLLQNNYFAGERLSATEPYGAERQVGHMFVFFFDFQFVTFRHSDCIIGLGFGRR